MALEGVEALELGGDDERVEGLSAAALSFGLAMNPPGSGYQCDVGRGAWRGKPWRGSQAGLLTRHVCDFNVDSTEALLDGLAHGLICDLRHVCVFA